MHDMLILWKADIPQNMIDILQPHTFNPADPQRIIIPFVALITLHIQCLCHVHHTCHVSCFVAWTTLIALFRFNAFVAFMPLSLWTSSRTAVTSSLHCSVARDPPSMSNAEASQSTTTAAPTGATAPSNAPRSTARQLSAFIASITGAGAHAGHTAVLGPGVAARRPLGDPALGVTSASPLCK
jgi:hypothetical protein